MTFQVADVTRALHSTGVICDTNKEVLLTKGEAVVVPEGALSRHLCAVRRLAEYTRKGGLYVAKMKIRRRSGRGNFAKDVDRKTASPFGRQGIKK